MGADELTVKTNKDLDAILSLHAASQFHLGREIALNGIPADYQAMRAWFDEMGVTNTPVASRLLAKVAAEGLSTALSTAPLLERLLLSKEATVALDK